MPQKITWTLLIIDDSQEDRHIAMDYIKRHQDGVVYRFLEAGTVSEALALCDQVAIDCVLVDYRLPDGSGIDFLRALFQRREGYPIGAIFMTGMGSEKIAVSAMREGAVDYVSKNDMHSEALMRALEHARGAVEARRKLAEAERARMVAQSEQMRSEGDLQRLIESIRDYAIITLDLGGRVARWGAGARRLLGYHDHEAIGLRFDDMVHRAEAGAIKPADELNGARQKPVNCAGRWFVRRDGGLFWGTSLLSPIESELGAVCGFALVIHDISAWRDITQRFHGDLPERDLLSQRFLDGLRLAMTRIHQDMTQMQQSIAAATPAERSTMIAALVQQVQHLQASIEQCADYDHRIARADCEQVEQVSLAEVLKHYTTMPAPMQSVPVALEGEAMHVRGPWDAQMLLQAFENIFSHARHLDPQVVIEVHPQRQGDKVSVGINFHTHNGCSDPMFSSYAAEFRIDGDSDLRLAVARFIIENLGGHLETRRLSPASVTLDIRLPLSESGHG